MRNLLEEKTHRLVQRLAGSPLLVLGLSVMTSVALISACLSLLAPEAEAAAARSMQVKSTAPLAVASAR